MEFNHSLCWQIRSGSRPPSRIFGTVHQLDSTRIQVPMEELGALLDETGALCVEVDFGAGGDEMDESLTAGLITDQGDISELDSRYQDRLIAILETSDVGQAMIPILDRIPLSLLAMMTMIEKQRRSEYFSEPNLEIETEFVKLATSKGYPVQELETVKQQSAMLTGTGESEVGALDSLKQAINAFDDPYSPDMFARYAAQDLNLLPAQDMNAPAMVERHKSLALRLRELLMQQAMLVLVGAAHLGGENGMLANLAEDGFSVQPYPLEIRS